MTRPLDFDKAVDSNLAYVNIFDRAMSLERRAGLSMTGAPAKGVSLNIDGSWQFHSSNSRKNFSAMSKSAAQSISPQPIDPRTQ